MIAINLHTYQKMNLECPIPSWVADGWASNSSSSSVNITVGERHYGRREKISFDWTANEIAFVSVRSLLAGSREEVL